MDTDRIRAALERERERLHRIRQEIAEEAPSADEPQQDWISELSGYDQHPGDVGTETFEQEKLLSIAEQVEAAMRDVEDALARLEDGSYGSCEICGKQIDEERLRARPAARFCVDDQKKVERDLHPQGGTSR